MDGQEGGMDFLDQGVDEAAAGLDSGAGGSTAGAAAAPSPAPAAPSGGSGAVPGAPLSQEEWRALPKAWKQEFGEHWGKLDPNLQQYIHTREKQALDGLMQYKSQVDGWNQLFEPYKQWLDHYQVNPHEVTQRMMNAHLTLLHGTPEQKRQVAAQLAKDYKLAELLGGQPGQAEDPVAQHLQQALAPVAERLQRLETQTMREQRAKVETEVNTFLGDAKNEFAQEVLPDMVKLLNAGLASDLPSAYEQACRLNPAVARKIFERSVEGATKPVKPAPTNVSSSPVPPAPTANPNRTLEEDMSDIFDQITNR